MKRYRELGEFGLLDQRGRCEEYINQDRYVQKLNRDSKADAPNQKWVTDIKQYRVGETYHDMLPKVRARISMSCRGNCYDNASMESFFSYLKTDGLYPYDIRNMDEAQRKIEDYIRFNNQHRPQRILNKLPPIQYRKQLIG